MATSIGQYAPIFLPGELPFLTEKPGRPQSTGLQSWTWPKQPCAHRHKTFFCLWQLCPSESWAWRWRCCLAPYFSFVFHFVFQLVLFLTGKYIFLFLLFTGSIYCTLFLLDCFDFAHGCIWIDIYSIILLFAWFCNSCLSGVHLWFLGLGYLF